MAHQCCSHESENTAEGNCQVWSHGDAFRLLYSFCSTMDVRLGSRQLSVRSRFPVQAVKLLNGISLYAIVPWHLLKRWQIASCEPPLCKDAYIPAVAAADLLQFVSSWVGSIAE